MDNSEENFSRLRRNLNIFGLFLGFALGWSREKIFKTVFRLC
jgi:hypothetical protein